MSKTNPEAIAEHISEKSSATINALVQNDTLAAADNPVLQGNFAPVNKELTLENFAVVAVSLKPSTARYYAMARTPLIHRQIIIGLMATACYMPSSLKMGE